MFILYDIIFLFFLMVYLPIALVKGKGHWGMLQRWGNFSPALRERLKGRSNIWVHAVSVGEVLAVQGLIQALHLRFPAYQMVVTTVTKTGYELAQNRLQGLAVILYAPVDMSWVVHRYMTLIRPKIYLCVETEIWPNLFWALAHHRVPVIIVNGRISDHSFLRYRKLRFFLKRPLSVVQVFCMQSAEDARRVIVLGAPADRVQVVGNMKFDGLKAGPTDAKVCRLPEAWADCVWVAGSTHPGEERIVLEIYGELRKRFARLRLIIAPRHIERIAEVAQDVSQLGFQPVMFSQIDRSPLGDQEVIVVDTIGQLAALYQSATIVFVGKSLTGKGGQNILEPAAFGKPIIVGPYMQNFRQIMEQFLAVGAIRQVQDVAGLQAAMCQYLTHPPQAQALGERARTLIGQNQGATERTLSFISSWLES
jgi:3-deoxy-D-manno-octulosonic-acid transferase